MFLPYVAWWSSWKDILKSENNTFCLSENACGLHMGAHWLVAEQPSTISNFHASIADKLLSVRYRNLDSSHCICMSVYPGVVTSSLFDQLQTASFIGGFNATIRGAAPAMSNFITTGSDPFVAVYSAVEVSFLRFYSRHNVFVYRDITH